MTKEILSYIYDYTLDELKERLKPSFRAKQVYNWLYKKYANSYDDMKNLPKELIEDLKANYLAYRRNVIGDTTNIFDNDHSENVSFNLSSSMIKF